MFIYTDAVEGVVWCKGVVSLPNFGSRWSNRTTHTTREMSCEMPSKIISDTDEGKVSYFFNSHIPNVSQQLAAVGEHVHQLKLAKLSPMLVTANHFQFMIICIHMAEHVEEVLCVAS